jgi:hypothetical protein
MEKVRSRHSWSLIALLAFGITVAMYVFEVESGRWGWIHFEARRAVKQVESTTTRPAPIVVADAGPAIATIEAFELEEPILRSNALLAQNNLREPLEPAPLVTLLAPIPDSDADGIPESEVIDPALEATEPTFIASRARLASVKRLVDETSQQSELPSVPLQARPLESGGWPAAPALIAALDRLMESPLATDSPLSTWHDDIEQQLFTLWGLDSLKSEESLVCLETINGLIADGEILAQQITDRETAYRLRVAIYALQRRIVVWHSIWQALQRPNIQLVELKTSDLSPQSMRLSLEKVRQLVAKTGDAEGWGKYLLLDEIDTLLKQETFDAKVTSPIARKFLARVTWQRLTPDQQDFVQREAIAVLREQLYPWAQQPVNYRRMLVDLELLEEDPINRCRASLADSLQNLRFSPQPELVQIAHAMNDFYRNANLRVAVSKNFVERMLPKRDWEYRPVRQKILGADTRGDSQVLTKLSIDFIPSDSAWQLELGVNGFIKAQTRSVKGPATLFNRQDTEVVTKRSLRIDARELKVEKSGTTVHIDDRLQRMDTTLDPLPVINQFFRAIVAQQVEEQRGVAQTLVKRIVQQQVDSEVDKSLNEQLSQAEEKLVDKVLEPLERLQLNPLVVDLQTTEQRLLVRYRVAAQTQLAAHTPRPRAPGDSELSVQIHQSALNNTVAQLGLGDRMWPLKELCERLATSMGNESLNVGADIPNNVSIRFAPYRPISVEFDRGKVWLTLRIAELHQEDGIHLERFIVRTSYLADVNGLLATLTHDGPISIDGYRLGIRERVPIRLIFSKVFSKHATIPLLGTKISEDTRLDGLSVSQLEFRDGWLAIALSSNASPHITEVRKRYPLRAAQGNASTGSVDDRNEAVRLE